MSAFNSYESEVLRVSLEGRYSDEQIDDVIENAKLVSLEHTGDGYFLTVAHPLMPAARTVCSDPSLVGRFQDVLCGFVLFLEGGELMFECVGYPSSANLDGVVPEDIRELPVMIEKAG